MISLGSWIYPILGSVKVLPSRVASPENYKHQTLKVSGVTPTYLTQVQMVYPHYFLNGNINPATNLVKDLGILHSSDFSWSAHIHYQKNTKCLV